MWELLYLYSIEVPLFLQKKTTNIVLYFPQGKNKILHILTYIVLHFVVMENIYLCIKFYPIFPSGSTRIKDFTQQRKYVTHHTGIVPCMTHEV